MIYLLIFVYILSAFVWRLYIHLAHGKNGIYSNIKPDGIWRFIMVCPFVNTFCCLIGGILHYPIKNR